MLSLVWSLNTWLRSNGKTLSHFSCICFVVCIVLQWLIYKLANLSKNQKRWLYLTFLTIHKQGTESLHLWEKRKQEIRKKGGRKGREGGGELEITDRHSRKIWTLKENLLDKKESTILLSWKVSKSTLLLQHSSDPSYFGTLPLESLVWRPWSSGWVFARGHLLESTFPGRWTTLCLRRGSCQVPHSLSFRLTVRTNRTLQVLAPGNVEAHCHWISIKL